MWKRSILTTAVFLGIGMSCAIPGRAAQLFAQLFPLTGEVRLLNRGAAPVPFVYYSITSAAGALNPSPAVWKSIDDFYDVSGNGLIDPTNEWVKLSAHPTELTEGVFAGLGGSIPGLRAVSLGMIWNPFATPFPDLVFDIHDPAGQLIYVSPELAVAGDYSGDWIVDQADYVIWRRNFGSTTALSADGNLNGIVDMNDYLIWRQNYGSLVPLPPYAAALGDGSQLVTASVVPEPGAVATAIGAIVCLLLGRKWFGRRLHARSGLVGAEEL